MSAPALAEFRGMAPLPKDIMDRAAVAEYLDVDPHTVTRYVNASRRRLARGLPLRPQDLPLPEYLGATPYWHRKDIEAFKRARPGQGFRSDLRQGDEDA